MTKERLDCHEAKASRNDGKNDSYAKNAESRNDENGMTFMFLLFLDCHALTSSSLAMTVMA